MRNKIFLWVQQLIERGYWGLTPLSFIFQGISWIRNRLYDVQILPVIKVTKPVISIGNLVAGGTGKTPFVHLLASAFSCYRVAILSRGYGKVPDEALFLQKRLPKAKVYIGKNRAHLAKKAIEEGADLIILDDGFQHRRLFRDLDIVLLDGEDLYGKGYFLPRGYLRDHPKRLQSADYIFTSEKDFFISKVVCWNLKEEEISLKDARVALFSGIAKPHKFRRTVENLGAQVIDEWILADHEPVDPRAICKFSRRIQKAGGQYLVCTEKDMIKMPQVKTALPIVYLEIAIDLTSMQKWEELLARIGQKIQMTRGLR